MKPVIILLLHTLAAVLGTESANTTESGQCIRAPPHAQPADSHYRLGVAGDPDLFLPGELYTVTLEGVDSGQGPTPFIGFTIWAELVGSDANATEPSTNQTLGTFQTYAAQAVVRDTCVPSVVNSTAHQKIEIQVIWSPPIAAADMCVRLCARAGPAAAAAAAAAAGDSWSTLARKICAAPTAPASFARQPPIVEPCCACDEAKYEVTFEGHWSRNTHPRDFPQESDRAHFSDVIGASHTAQYRVWQEGRAASAGLRRLADDGATTQLEKELKAESDHIRTIIKARGISWQQVAVGGNPSTFAVFRVDAKHHLVSLAAKLAPSPDWIVGVSALELCNRNCTWSSSMTLPLYPYDAGTDSGITYTSRRHPTTPAAPVRALRPDWPRSEQSPFYNVNGDMRPFARLKLNRLRLYEKPCDGAEQSAELSEPHLPGGGALGACSAHAWAAWGACSVTCGRGRQSRQREYIWPARALADACRAQLTDYRPCYGPRRHCRAPSDYEPDPAESSGPCAVSQWSEWSRCEGCGVRFRERKYIAPRAFKKCNIGFRASTIMHQAMPCEAGPCDTPPHLINSTNFDWWFVQDNTNSACPTTSWSSWSPCSARCGRGRRLRSRLYLARRSQLQHEVARRLFRHWVDQYNDEAEYIQRTGPNFPEEPDTPSSTPGDPEVTTKVSELEEAVNDLFERCKSTLTVQESLCDGEGLSCPPPEGTCKQPMSTGPCRRYAERWFFDFPKQNCEPFGYSGCGGNDNNFHTREACEQVCLLANNTLDDKEDG